MFTQLELLISLRYLRSKRSEGFISVIAGFSLVGIILGVATLIIVMSVIEWLSSRAYRKNFGS